MSDNPTTAAVAEKPTEVTEVQVEASEPAAVSEKTEAAATEAKPVEGEAKATDGEPKAANGEKKAEESADKPTEETKENNSSFERRQNGDRGRGRGRGRGAPTTGQKRITNREERERRYVYDCPICKTLTNCYLGTRSLPAFLRPTTRCSSASRYVLTHPT